MCGICGFVTQEAINFKQLKRMNDTMFHRGPDDSDIGNGYICGMAHRRLSIMDVTSAGHQPMISDDANITVVFNGEIYNFKELKKILTHYEFKTNCDTEIIIAAYKKWGAECFLKFNGMFAIAIYEKKQIN